MICQLLYALEIIILQYTIQMNKDFTNACCTVHMQDFGATACTIQVH